MNLFRLHAFVLRAAIACGLVVAVSACRKMEDVSGTPPPGCVRIPAGTYNVGSSEHERTTALSHVRPQDEDAARTRLAKELDKAEVRLGGFWMGAYPVTNRQYAEFVADTGHREPTVDTAKEWEVMCAAGGLGLDAAGDFERYVRSMRWRDGHPPRGREDDPVTLVDTSDAQAYCRWLSKKLDLRVRLPDELESEAGAGPSAYPWGDGWSAGAAHAGVDKQGTASVAAVGAQRKPEQILTANHDISPLGVADYAGQVYEWTASPDGGRRGFTIAKGGGSWLDGPLDCRRAARRALPDATRHVLLGFRIVVDGD